MRRVALLLVVLAAGLGALAAGCGGEENQTATPETTEGAVPTQTTETQTTETQTTETGTTGTETTETQTTEPAGKGDPAAGKQVFLGAPACGGCHTLADAGSTGNVGPNLDETKPSYDLVVERVTNGRGAMPSFSGTLTPQQIADVAAYVSSVAGQ